jgi:hypothetical protein
MDIEYIIPVSTLVLFFLALVTSEKTTSRKDFTMQNCFVEKRKRMAFLSKHLNSSFVICDTIFFADKK